MKSEMRGIIEAQRIERRWRAARRVSPALRTTGLGVGDDALISRSNARRTVRIDTDPSPSPIPSAIPSQGRPLVLRNAEHRGRTNGAAYLRPRARPLTAYLYARDVPMLAAIPLVPIVLAVLFPVFGAFDFYARQVGVRVPAAAAGELAVRPVTTDARGGDAPISVDATNFEQIRRTEYTVRPGDTVSEIAQRYGLRLDTLMSANTFDDVRRLLPGTVLSIPNRDGVFHAIMPGESLSSIASSYGIPVSAILDANDLRSERLAVGESLFIPGARMDTTQLLLAIGELFQWPVRRFRFTSPYGMRIHPITGLWHLHNGIDLAGPIGTPVLAARSGRVVHMENDTAGYGRMIILDHGGGFRTLYAHLDAFRVRVGQYVSTGQQIGTLGNTGRSTGPHLHFSVIRNGRWEDPMKHLAR